MFKDTIYLKNNRILWWILPFIAGFVDVGGFLSVHRFVSHVTGFAAHFGMEVSSYKWFEALVALLVPLCFLLGAFGTAIFTEVRRSRHQVPIYFWSTATVGCIYIAIATAGDLGFFGSFGEPMTRTRDFVLLILLCFATGAQNALFTSYSGAIVRTTHLTGLTTDLGIGIARQFVGKNREESQRNKLRIAIIVWFLLGSASAGAVFSYFGFRAFYIPGVLSLLVGVRLLLTRVGN